MEVFEDNEVEKGYRTPLEAFNLPPEPWLFAVDREGRDRRRIDGSLGATSSTCDRSSHSRLVARRPLTGLPSATRGR